MPDRERSQIFVYILLVILVLVLVMFLVRPPVSSPGLRSDTDPTVAILVVDAFEVLPDAEPTPENETGGAFCLVTPDGESHYVGSGAAAKVITGAAAKVITGAAAKVITGAAGTATLDTHGRLVYSQLESLLRLRGGTLEDFVMGVQLWSNQPYIRDVGRWDMGDGNDVLLVAVDTEGYTTDLIGPYIRETIVSVSDTLGVEQFVVNMSFVVVPCGDVVDPQEYAAFIQDNFPDLYAALEDALANGEDPVDVILNSPDYEAFRAEARAERQEAADQTLSSCYVVDTGDVDLTGGPKPSDFARLSQVEPTPEPPTPIPGEGSPEPLGQQQPTQIPGEGSPEPPGQQQVQQGEDPRLTPDCQPLVAGEDALAQTLDQLNGLSLPGGRTATVVAVGASGNTDTPYSFAPGYWPTVISVGADYRGKDNEAESDCAVTRESLTVGNEVIYSNCGEVKLNGIYANVAGSSFAAPRLSLQAAVYLLRGGEVFCTDPNGNRRTLPLMGYADVAPVAALDGLYDFQNYTRIEAAALYCPNFNVLLSQP